MGCIHPFSNCCERIDTFELKPLRSLQCSNRTLIDAYRVQRHTAVMKPRAAAVPSYGPGTKPASSSKAAYSPVL
jgi:hypothetical protein